MWVVLSLLSAFCLGIYDISKKQSLRFNSVTLVLCINILLCSLIVSIPLLMSRLGWGITADSYLYVPVLDRHAHCLVFLKSALVLSSWVASYMSLKHLPISICGPAQATRPIWTLLGAVLIFGEQLNGWQWSGVLCVIAAGLYAALIGPLTRPKQSDSLTYMYAPADDRKYYVWLLVAILTGSASGLYDKFMMRQLDHNAVQAYYTLYQAAILLVWFGLKHAVGSLQHKPVVPVWHDLRWTWALPIVSIALVLSDNVYMLALRDPDSLIAVVSCCRRSGVLIGFLFGIFFLHEGGLTRKLPAMLAILAALACLCIGSIV